MSLPPFFLERARAEDLEALLLLERAAFTHPWTASQLGEEIAPRAGGGMLVLRTRGGAILAYLAYRLVAEELTILNLAVAALHRRRGLGSWLMRFVLELGTRGGARRALLEVRPGNRTALALYEGLGFTVLSVRPGYYVDPPEDAYVLGRALEAGEGGAGRKP